MWTLATPESRVTNKVTVPADGIITIAKPEGTKIKAYVNDMHTEHLHVKAGDNVCFEVTGSHEPTSIGIMYNGTSSVLNVAKQDIATNTTEGNNMTEAVNLFATPNSGMGGAIGGGLGAGLLGGVLGGALLGGNRGGLFGGGNSGGDSSYAAINAINSNTDNSVAAAERLSMARFDADSQRDIQAAIERTAAATQLAQAVGNSALAVEVAKGQGEINTQVALTTGNLGTQNALNAAATQTLVQKVSGDLGTQVALGQSLIGTQVERAATANAIAFKDVAIQAVQNKYELANAIKADGDLTRGLITSNYQDTLNRQLATAQNEIIELRGDRNMNNRAKETEVNVTQIVSQNQAQAQAQQQQQLQYNILNQLAALNADLQTVKQSSVVFNSGTQTGSGNQSAANTRVA
jgi:hypothetical protein